MFYHSGGISQHFIRVYTLCVRLWVPPFQPTKNICIYSVYFPFMKFPDACFCLRNYMFTYTLFLRLCNFL